MGAEAVEARRVKALESGSRSARSRGIGHQIANRLPGPTFAKESRLDSSGQVPLHQREHRKAHSKAIPAPQGPEARRGPAKEPAAAVGARRRDARAVGVATEIGATTPICPNAFPAVAAKTPNKANAEANPTANAIAFTRIADFFASSFSSSFSFSDDDAYPPMYPNVNGNTDSVHGDKLVTNPATNTNTNVVGEACADADDVTLLNKLPLLFAIISPPPPPNAPLTNASNPDVTSNSDFDNTASATFAISLVLSTINAFVGVLRRPKARRRRRKR